MHYIILALRYKHIYMVELERVGAINLIFCIFIDFAHFNYFLFVPLIKSILLSIYRFPFVFVYEFNFSVLESSPHIGVNSL